jgi:D-alanyl-D-alanine carboxypeptidase
VAWLPLDNLEDTQLTVLRSLLSHGQPALAQTSADLLEQIRSIYHVPTLGAGSITPSRKVQGHVVGVRKQGNDTKSTIDDQFHLGSNTRAMTSVLIAKFIEDGKLTWDTTLAQALPSYAEQMKPAHRNITVAQLASHVSGLTDNVLFANDTTAAWYFALRALPALEGRSLYVEAIFNTTPNNTQKEYSYSNQNYALLGFVIDNNFGPWEDILQRELFKPLHMDECGFSYFPEPTPYSVEGLWPHLQGDLDPIPQPPSIESDNPLAIGPAGLVRCSIRSYAKVLSLHLDGAAGRDTQVLKASSFPRLHNVSIPNSHNYTCGAWSVMENYGPSIGAYLYHDGSNRQNYAIATILPKLGYATIALTNVAGYTDSNVGALATSNVTVSFFGNKLDDLPVLDAFEEGCDSSGGSPY